MSSALLLKYGVRPTRRMKKQTERMSAERVGIILPITWISTDCSSIANHNPPPSHQPSRQRFWASFTLFSSAPVIWWNNAKLAKRRSEENKLEVSRIPLFLCFLSRTLCLVIASSCCCLNDAMPALTVNRKNCEHTKTSGYRLFQKQRFWRRFHTYSVLHVPWTPLFNSGLTIEYSKSE